MILAAKGHPKITAQLLEAGADPTLRNETSETALMLAVADGCVPCAQALIAGGADPGRRNSRGQNARDMAGSVPELMAALGY